MIATHNGIPMEYIGLSSQGNFPIGWRENKISLSFPSFQLCCRINCLPQPSTDFLANRNLCSQIQLISAERCRVLFLFFFPSEIIQTDVKEALFRLTDIVDPLFFFGGPSGLCLFRHIVHLALFLTANKTEETVYSSSSTYCCVYTFRKESIVTYYNYSAVRVSRCIGRCHCVYALSFGRRINKPLSRVSSPSYSLSLSPVSFGTHRDAFGFSMFSLFWFRPTVEY